MSQQEPDGSQEPSAVPEASTPSAPSTPSTPPTQGAGGHADVPEEPRASSDTNTLITGALVVLGLVLLTGDWTWLVVGAGMMVTLLVPQLGNARMGVLLGVLAFVGLVHGWIWVAVIAGLVVMIFLHELGHFLTARWSGMKATEFFLGFGPKLWSFRRGETEYGVKAIWLGAYVRIIGMTTAEEVPPEDEDRTYRQKSFPKRLLVVSAGSLMHLGQALVVALILLVVVGMPGGKLVQADPAQDRDWEVAAVTPGSAADGAGVEPGDRVVNFDGRSTETFDEVVDAVADSEVGDVVTLEVDRGGEVFAAETRVVDRCDVIDEGFEGPFLGVSQTRPEMDEAEQRGVVDGSVQAVQDTGEVLLLTSEGIGRFLTNLPSFFGELFDRGGETRAACVGQDDSEGAAAAGSGDSSSDREMMSIVGAVHLAVNLDAEGLLMMFFLINLTIGFVNMLPILPLDGGHALVACYERVRSRRGKRYYADANKLIPFAYAGLMLLVMIGATAMFLDITDPLVL